MSNDFYSEKTVRSRKRRRCACSFAWIEIGAPHIYAAGLSDGEFFTARIHPVAHEIYKRRNEEIYKANGFYEGLSFDDLLEDVLERDKHPTRDADAAALIAIPGVPVWFAERIAKEKGIAP